MIEKPKVVIPKSKNLNQNLRGLNKNGSEITHLITEIMTAILVRDYNNYPRFCPLVAS